MIVVALKKNFDVWDDFFFGIVLFLRDNAAIFFKKSTTIIY